MNTIRPYLRGAAVLLLTMAALAANSVNVPTYMLQQQVIRSGMQGGSHSGSGQSASPMEEDQRRHKLRMEAERKAAADEEQRKHEEAVRARQKKAAVHDGVAREKQPPPVPDIKVFGPDVHGVVCYRSSTGHMSCVKVK